MITINDLNFGYRGSKREVLSNMNLELRPNCICGLLGKNGVGKSTLLYLIAGLLKPKSGKVTVNGHESWKSHPEMLKDIFMVTEEFSLPAVTLDEYIRINAPFYPNFSRELMNECMKDFELPEIAKVNELSMGQKKKLFMAFALATNTQVLLMDEPTNGLDIPSKAQFRKVISRSMSDDRLIIISTHQVHDVDKLLDHVVILSNDGVLMSKSTAEICDEYVFEYRMPDDMADVIYAVPSLQGNAVMAPRGNREETSINLELLFNAVTEKGINLNS